MKKIKLKEESYNKLVNEISHGVVDNASRISDNIFWKLSVAFDEFYDALKYETDHDNPYVRKIMAHASVINDILERKTIQRRNFDKELTKFDYNKFYDDAEKPEEWEDNYDDLDLRMLQDKYPKDNSNMRFNDQHMVQK